MAKPTPEVRFMGAFMMVIGFLMMSLCGLCTLAFGVSMAEAVLYGGFLGWLPIMAVVGVLPTGIGVLLLTLGYRRYHGR